MPVIRPLPEDVASRIAAGEVIERPASVLKELLENSLDAGASRVSVSAERAGRSLLRVADDGAGMEPADCRCAFERHTTSKISRLEDLDRLATFGFRGEALFSIAAVSRTSLTSTPRGSRKGWRVEMSGGRLQKEHEAPPAPGTTVEVRDLFFNTPARAKFLKSDASERSHLARTLEEAALANPGTAFSLSFDGRVSLDFPAAKGDGAKALRARARDVLGDELGEALLLAEHDAPALKLLALLVPSDRLHSSRSLQFCFVNRRPVSSRTIQQALYRAYEPFRGHNRHPAAVLFLEAPADRLDVNVHPTKREVRFSDEGAVFEAVTKALSRALLGAKGIPTLARGRLAEPPRPAPSIELPSFPSGVVESVVREPAAPFIPPPAPGGPLAAPAAAPGMAGRGEGRPWFSEPLRYLGQIERAYLVFESEGGLLVVDQHAAQERVLFERYLAQVKHGEPQVQKLMLPTALDLPASAVQKVLALKARLKRAGIEVEAFGKTTLHVTAMPALFKDEDVKGTVHRLLDGLLSPKAAAADARYDAAALVACKAAVKAHDPLSAAEAARLVEDLRRCEDGTCCPHGRPSMLSMDRQELARRFGRPGAPPVR